jgi:hypothetical protein
LQQLREMIGRIRTRMRPSSQQTEAYPQAGVAVLHAEALEVDGLPASHGTHALTDRERGIRCQAADYAWDFLVTTGLAGRNRSEVDHEAWLLGERLRELYLNAGRTSRRPGG